MFPPRRRSALSLRHGAQGRGRVLAAGALLLLAAAAPSPPENAEPLPVPPVPPRLGESADSDRCMGMLATDPAGAANFAEAWEATGGGDPATQCLALARIEQGDPAGGAAMLDKLAGSSRAGAAERAALYDEADQAWIMADRPSEAYASGTLALTLAPDEPDLLVDRSIAAATLERYEQAEDDLSAALTLDPSRIDAWVLRAAARRHLNRLDDAEADIARAVSLDPDDPDALLERGIIRQRRGDLAGAREDWERVGTLAPDTPSADLAEQNLALLQAGPRQ
jgi:tetratricopeptide (TPR) repeat protein